MTTRLPRLLRITVFIALASTCVGCSAPTEDAAPPQAGSGPAGARAPDPSTVTNPATTVGAAGASGVGAASGHAADSGPAGRNAAAGAGGRAANGGSAGRNRMGNAGGGAGGSAAGSGGAAPADATIWMPKPGTTWQWQLTGTVDSSLDVQMYDIDLFASSDALIQTLHHAGHKVVCYFSAGSYEPDRPDSAALQQTGLGKTLDGWPDEKWLDIRKPAVRDLMKARLDLAKSKQCDGVEPDNVDGYDNDNGLSLTMQDELDYDQFLASEAHARQLSIGLKNSLALVPKLVSSFDWALNEECLKYSECDELTAFIKADKAVFHCEYASNTNGICGKAPQGFSTIVKNLDLDATRLACN
jgi:hypothetical protein